MGGFLLRLLEFERYVERTAIILMLPNGKNYHVSIPEIGLDVVGPDRRQAVLAAARTLMERGAVIHAR